MANLLDILRGNFDHSSEAWRYALDQHLRGEITAAQLAPIRDEMRSNADALWVCEVDAGDCDPMPAPEMEMAASPWSGYWDADGNWVN